MENQKKKYSDPLFGFVNEPWKDEEGNLTAIPFTLYKSHLKEIMDTLCTNPEDDSKSKARLTLFLTRAGDWKLRVWNPYSEEAKNKQQSKQRVESKAKVESEEDDMPF
jgi:hypothetical protein